MAKDNLGLIVFGGAILILGVDFLTSSNNGGTREDNDNNPCGITGNGQESYPGIVGTDPPLLVFDTKQNGLNAAAFNLYQYFHRDNVNTIDGIGNRWSGSASDYASNLEGFTGFQAGSPLNYWFNGISILNGISKAENGGGYQLPYSQLALALVAGAAMGQA